MTRKNRARIRKSTKRTGRKNTRKYRGGFFNLFKSFKDNRIRNRNNNLSIMSIPDLEKEYKKCWRKGGNQCRDLITKIINDKTYKQNNLQKNIDTHKEPEEPEEILYSQNRRPIFLNNTEQTEQTEEDLTLQNDIEDAKKTQTFFNLYNPMGGKSKKRTRRK